MPEGIGCTFLFKKADEHVCGRITKGGVLADRFQQFDGVCHVDSPFP